MQSEKQIVSGMIVFLRTNVGSKSEAVLPHLYCGKDEPMLPLYIKDDNPFENKGLVAYDGQRVVLSGAIEHGKFIVEQIRQQDSRDSVPSPTDGAPSLPSVPH